MKYRPSLLTIIATCILLFFGIVLGAHVVSRYTTPTQVEPEQGYIIKGNKVYYRTVMQVGENGTDQIYDSEMKDAEAKAFVMLDVYWAKDEDTLFYMGQTVVPEINTTLIDLPSFGLIEKTSGLGKDKNAVYIVSPNQTGWSYKAIPEADPATFTMVEGFPYATDTKNAYYLDLPFEVKKIEGADGQTFAVLGQCAAVEVSRAYYAWDAKSIIAGDKLLAGADRNTFKIVAGFDSGPDGMYVAGTYSVDKNRVYKNCGEIVPTGNPDMCGPMDIKQCE